MFDPYLITVHVALFNGFTPRGPAVVIPRVFGVEDEIEMRVLPLLYGFI